MVEFHVSPTGDDATPGTAGQPFATLERARRAAREATGDVVVHLRAGTHVLTEPPVSGTLLFSGERVGERLELGPWDFQIVVEG